MDAKVIKTLELDKVLAQLREYVAFSGGAALVEALAPTPDLDEAQYRQQETREAQILFDLKPDLTLGGTRDVRQVAQEATREFVLTPDALLDVKQTLQAGAALKRGILKHEDDTPLLAATARRIHEITALVDEIKRTLSPLGDVLDNASDTLSSIRHDLRRAHERLQNKLNSIVNSRDNAPYLQEAIVTMRGGRYVIPIKAEAKGRIKGVVHDQSSSGATLFIEPLATVEINNQVRELELAEEEEIHRLLRELSALVGQHAPEIIETVGTLAALDLAFAKARYANALDAYSPELVPFPNGRGKDGHPGSTVRLYAARHPLLDPSTVVPIDIELDEDTYALVITGPNTGGKTVSLKTIGLLVLMAQCGLHIPAAPESALTVFERVCADIGDEQSIEQSLSTFSGHLTNIIPILEQADERSLVILDELGAGTDPGEGSALARAILSQLLQRGATTFVATHYPELKAYAHSTPGVRNASVQFDFETLAPTYRLLVGLPGRSNAFAIASRLGLSDSILEDARTMVGQTDLQIEDLLDEINRTRGEIQATQERLEATYTEAAQVRDELRQRLHDIEAERHAVLETAHEEARVELAAIRAEVAELRERLLQAIEAAEAQETIEAVEEAVDALEDAQAELPQPEPLAPIPDAPQPGPPDDRDLLPGDRVYVRGLDTEGELLELSDGQAEVQLGRLRMRVDVDDLAWRASPQPQRAERDAPVSAPRPDSPGLELHLRGLIVEDALVELDRYIDTAYLAGLPWVRIVHGKGGGKLRQAVHDALRGHPLIDNYEQAPEREGGSGVTVAHFVPGG